MATIQLPVRFYGHEEYILPIRTEATALLVIDSDGESLAEVKRNHIAPALDAVRRLGIKVAYFHEDGYGQVEQRWLCANQCGLLPEVLGH